MELLVVSGRYLGALPLHLVDGAGRRVLLPRAVPFRLALPLSCGTSGVQQEPCETNVKRFSAT